MKYYVIQRCVNHRRKSLFASYDTFDTYKEALEFFNNKRESFRNYPCYIKGDVIETTLLNTKQILELQKDF